MKIKFKKVVSIALALIALFALSLTAFAADISAEDAKTIAVSDAGYSLSDVLYIRAEYEVDDGIKHWNVDFLVEDENGRKVDYDYEVSASDGRILEKDREFENEVYDDALENRFEAFFRKIVAWFLSLFK